ncbi:uncharacterized protein FYW61_007089 isoform 2-T2 [Anableps anableps]
MDLPCLQRSSVGLPRPHHVFVDPQSGKEAPASSFRFRVSAMEDGRQTQLVEDSEGRRGCSPEVHRRLHRLEQVKLQVVLTAPVDQPIHLCLNADSSLFWISGAIREFQEFHKQVR